MVQVIFGKGNLSDNCHEMNVNYSCDVTKEKKSDNEFKIPF